MIYGGSSPQAWGTWRTLLEIAREARFIPTGVGNILTTTVKEQDTPVHPHRRGEHVQLQRLITVKGGSSPQAWGTYRSEILCECLLRFIPTGVGNMRKFRESEKIQTVHPHRRGEHASPTITIFDGFGSSPQAWGTFLKTKKFAIS